MLNVLAGIRATRGNTSGLLISGRMTEGHHDSRSWSSHVLVSFFLRVGSGNTRGTSTLTNSGVASEVVALAFRGNGTVSSCQPKPGEVVAQQ